MKLTGTIVPTIPRFPKGPLVADGQMSSRASAAGRAVWVLRTVVSLGQILSPPRTRDAISPHVAYENPDRKTNKNSTGSQNGADPNPLKAHGAPPCRPPCPKRGDWPFALRESVARHAQMLSCGGGLGPTCTTWD